MANAFHKWACKELEQLLGFVDDATVASIVDKENQELQELLTNFGVDPKKANKFAAELKKKKATEWNKKNMQQWKRENQRDAQFPGIVQGWGGWRWKQNLQAPVAKASAKKKTSPNASPWLSPRGNGGGMGTAYMKNKQGAQQQQQSNWAAEKDDNFFCSYQKDPALPSTQSQFPQMDKKKLAARKVCLCQGMKHQVLWNCLHCGKINCSEEGYGPCLFCGNELIFGGMDEMAERKNAQEVIALKKAVEAKNRLVQFDRESQKRTKVFDDAADWFSESINPWLSQAQRKKADTEGKRLERQKMEEKRKMCITFDFFGRQVVESAQPSELNAANEREKFEDWVDVDSKKEMMDQLQDVHGSGVNPQLLGASKDLYNSLRQNLSARPKVWAKAKAKPGLLKKLTSHGSKEGDDVLGQAMKGAAAEEDEKEKGGWKPRLANTEFDEDTAMGALFGDLENSMNAQSQENMNRQQSMELNFDHLDDYEQIEKSSKQNNSSLNKSQQAQSSQMHNWNRMFPPPKPIFSDGVDEGKCLTLHQPWASLIIYGFKRAEGRDWNVDGKNKNFNRGRLWIHAAVKEPDDSTVQGLEEHYRKLYGDYPCVPKMPSEQGGYPTGCILGCVDLHGIYSQEEYRAKRIQDVGGKNQDMIDESGSDYIFWLECPRKLVVPCKYTGDHKFWDIPKAQLKTLQAALLPVQWPGQGLPLQYEQAFTSTFDLFTGKPISKIQDLQRGSSWGGDGGNKDKSKIDGFQMIQVGKNKQTFHKLPEKIAENAMKTKDHQLLSDSCVHLFEFFSSQEQQEIINFLRNMGVSQLKQQQQNHEQDDDEQNAQQQNETSGFFVESFVADKAANLSAANAEINKKVKVAKMVFGNYMWNFKKSKWETGKRDYEIPDFLETHFKKAVELANKAIPQIKNKFVPMSSIKTKEFTPQVATVEYHHPEAVSSGDIVMRQEEAVSSGTDSQPVVYFNFGDAIKFSFSLTAPNQHEGTGANKEFAPTSVSMKSGDCIVFGNAARLMFHGVQEIQSESCPHDLKFVRPGRMSFIMK